VSRTENPRRTDAELAELAEAEVAPNEELVAPRPRSGRLARSTAFFSVATAFSRVAGLVREIVAASFFGISPRMSAFTTAFLIPNTIRSLFADAAIQAAFVPVFTEKLERGDKREAFRLASNLIFLVAVVLGLVTALFILLAPVLVDVLAPGYGEGLKGLTTSLSRLLFPILVLLGVSGMVVGVLNSYDRFAVFAIAPFFWNVAIIAVLVGLAPAFPERDEIYAYAIGVVVGTVVQLAMLIYDLRNTPFGIRGALFEPLRTRLTAFRDPDVRRVLLLMLPVTISLGLINVNLLVNGLFASLISDDAVAGIDKAFRIYMLPQGIFSVAVSTVLFPTLARFAARGELDQLRATMANGMRQIILLLAPATAAILVLSEPMIRIVYERGAFNAADTQLVSEALYWFAFSLPFNGLFLLLTRTFFSLQKPWVPSAIAALNLGVTALFSGLFYEPFGVGGIVAATAIATAASVVAQAVILRDALGRLELGRLAWTTLRVTLAAAALAAASYGVWWVLDDALGRSIVAQIVSIGLALGLGAAVYAAAVVALRVPEAGQIARLLRRSRGEQVVADEDIPDDAGDARYEEDLEAEEDFEAEEDLEDVEPEPAEPAEPLPELVVTSGDREGETFAIDHDRVTIGRATTSDIPLMDPVVSREHAVIVRTIDGDYIDDLDSRNGTFVNGRRIAAHLLRDGDEIRIGATTFTYRDR
jgi:putative peptidoglycan lipid II flippase